jgi:hypothetical protein
MKIVFTSLDCKEMSLFVTENGTIRFCLNDDSNDFGFQSADFPVDFVDELKRSIDFLLEGLIE